MQEQIFKCHWKIAEENATENECGSRIHCPRLAINSPNVEERNKETAVRADGLSRRYSVEPKHVATFCS